MHLLDVTCDRFRILRDVHFAPAKGINLLCGANAQGKTTVLEAILYLATSKSPRTAVESELVAHGEEGFRLKAVARRVSGDVTVEANMWQGIKRIKVNGIAQERVSDILGRISVVLFSPEDVALVKGGASYRRRFLDMELSQVHPGYLNALQTYRQVLRQRNELLRQPKAGPELLSVWDVQLAESGEVLIAERSVFLEQLRAWAQEAYRNIAGEETLELAYRPDVKHGALAQTLERSRQSDIRRGLTTRGPHRDDFAFEVSGQAARTYASQGQQKTAALALKLAELELVRERTGESPVLMLDEVLSELDAHRSRRLFSAIGPEVQCIMTTTDVSGKAAPDGVPCTRYLIEGGRLEKE